MTTHQQSRILRILHRQDYQLLYSGWKLAISSKIKNDRQANEVGRGVREGTFQPRIQHKNQRRRSTARRRIKRLLRPRPRYHFAQYACTAKTRSWWRLSALKVRQAPALKTLRAFLASRYCASLTTRSQRRQRDARAEEIALGDDKERTPAMPSAMPVRQRSNALKTSGQVSVKSKKRSIAFQRTGDP